MHVYGTDDHAAIAKRSFMNSSYAMGVNRPSAIWRRLGCHLIVQQTGPDV
jgi:hypothetical protein